MAERKAKVSVELPVSAIAASVVEEPGMDILSALDSFKSVEKVPHSQILKGSALEPHFRYSSPAYGRSNVGARRLFVAAADDHQLPSPRFEAVRVKFSDSLQALLCVPLAKFVSGEPDTLPVTWSKDGSEMRCDFAQVLIPKNWATPRGMARKAKVFLYRNLPSYGTAVMIALRESTLEELKSKTAEETSKGKAAADSQTESA